MEASGAAIQKIHNLDKKKYVIDESFKVEEAKLRELIQERAVPLNRKRSMHRHPITEADSI